MRRSAGLISTSIVSSTSGIDEDAGERGVAAGVGVEGRLAHEPVDAGLGAQHAVGVVAADLDGRALDAGDLALGLLEQFRLETAALGVTQVHALEHRRPVLRLGAARAGLDLDEAVVGVQRIVEHPLELEFADVPGEVGDVLLDRERASDRRRRRAPSRRVRPRRSPRLRAGASSRRSARRSSFPGRVPARVSGRPRPWGLRARCRFP